MSLSGSSLVMNILFFSGFTFLFRCSILFFFFLKMFSPSCQDFPVFLFWTSHLARPHALALHTFRFRLSFPAASAASLHLPHHSFCCSFTGILRTGFFSTIRLFLLLSHRFIFRFQNISQLLPGNPPPAISHRRSDTPLFLQSDEAAMKS